MSRRPLLNALVELRVALPGEISANQQFNQAVDLLDWLRPTEAAALLEVTRQALDRWIGRGKLPVAEGVGSSRLQPSVVISLAAEMKKLRDAGTTGFLMRRLLTD